MRATRLFLVVGLGIFLAACSVTSRSSPSAGVATKTSPRATVTTPMPPFNVPPAAACLGGTVTLPVLTPGEQGSACVKVGSTLVMAGGSTGSGGTWPGPPINSDMEVLNLISSQGGTEFKAKFKAISVGTSQVEVSFVNGPDVCRPTPCTPIPGEPLFLRVTVVS